PASPRRPRLARSSAPRARPGDPAGAAAVPSREGAELDLLAVELETRADDAVPAQAHVLAQARGRAARGERAVHLRQKALDRDGRRRGPVEPLERVEQVAG